MWPGVLGSGVGCLYFNMLHYFLFICEGFQATVLNILIKMQNDVKELERQIEHNAAFFQSMQQGAMDDCDLKLPDGLELPMSSIDHMDVMEVALEEGLFRKRLVSELCINCPCS